MSATSYYTTKARAGARTERIRTEIDRSSAYILDSGNLTSSYSSNLGRNSSFREGRSRMRDHSADFSMPRRRSSSMEIGAPVKLRSRDLSADYSSSYIKPTYTSTNRAPRPTTTNYDDDDGHSEEYKKIMKETESTLAMAKYAKKDSEAAKVDGMIEEERRSKAYRKIINDSSTVQREKDAVRSTMLEIFADTKGFSAKTMNAINKECLYKEDKGDKKYSWRKDMEGYEETLEKMNAHKRNVRDSTRATRDVVEPRENRYKDVNAKLRDYERESLRNVDDEPIVIKRPTVSSVTPTLTRKNDYNTSTSSYTNGTTSNYTNGSTTSYTNGSTSSYSNETKSYTNGSTTSYNNETKSYGNGYTNGYTNGTTSNDYENEEAPRRKKGSWRKDIEAYEENLNKTKTTSRTTRNVEPVKDEPTPVRSWQKSSTSDTTNSSSVSVASKPPTSSNYSVKPEIPAAKKVETKIEETPKWKKPEPVKQEEVPKWKKPETPKVEETKPTETKTATPSWKKPESTKIETPKVEEVKPAATPKPSKVEETKATEKTPTTTPKWKKPEAKVEETKLAEKPKVVEEKKEEAKPAETPKATPKWKKPETATKPAEPKPAEPEKPVPKWKKSVPAKKEEPKPMEEPPKPVPKWKKPETTKKEEPKPVEEPKPAPKWKKPETAKKEEAKPVEEPKPAPKWKKPETAKKEEPKPAEAPKPTPKWKKPETAKKEEPKPAEPEKPVPKWKKSATSKKEEDAPTVVEAPVIKEEEKPVVEEAPKPVEEESRLQPEPAGAPVEKKDEKKHSEEEKKEEEVEDPDGMKAAVKEQQTKFDALGEEFAQGASKLSALRQKMKALRMKHKAAAEADAAAEAAKQG